jgi:hypothetical protein
MTPGLPLTGGCVCGAVRFEVTAPLAVAGYCHCTRCQRRTGTGSSAQVRVAPDSVRIVAGEEHVRWYRPPDGFEKAFCEECGSALFSRPRDDSRIAAVRLGAFDGDPGVRPTYRQRVESAAVWEPIPDDGLPRHVGPLPGGHRLR